MDAKGRIGLPTRYHADALADCQGKFVITVDLYTTCLALYPLPEWEEIEARLNGLPSTQDFAMVKRRLIGYATDTNMDATGRLLISPELRAFAGLEKSVVLVGQGKKCEIWDKEAWDATQAQDMSAVFADPERVALIGGLGL